MTTLTLRRFFSPRGLLWACTLLLLGCRGGSPLADQQRALQLTASLRLQISQADKATARAVMADTPQASSELAARAEGAMQAATRDAAALGPLFERLRYAQEERLLLGFREPWAKFQKLNRELSVLAVQQTNVTAQKLAFGPAREAADSLQEAVSAVAERVPAAGRCAAERLALKTELAVRRTQLLQAPHIAEADDAAMTRLELAMAALDGEARASLNQLAELAGADASVSVARARLALDRFQEQSAQIVRLSRRNTNVRSLALLLREQPLLAAACDDSLRSLQQALEAEGSKATR